jgi:hypothetical protein
MMPEDRQETKEDDDGDEQQKSLATESSDDDSDDGEGTVFQMAERAGWEYARPSVAYVSLLQLSLVSVCWLGVGVCAGVFFCKYGTV